MVQAANQWFAAHRQHSQEAYARQQHLRRILDIREAGFPTPYVLSTVVEVVKSDPDDLEESYAVLVADYENGCRIRGCSEMNSRRSPGWLNA